MKEVHAIFRTFRDEWPDVCSTYEKLGEEIHLHGGPLPEKVRWLMKVAVSGATGHQRALETHLAKAKEAGASADEIQHTLLLLIPTCGFPAFMEAYSTYKGES